LAHIQLKSVAIAAMSMSILINEEVKMRNPTRNEGRRMEDREDSIIKYAISFVLGVAFIVLLEMAWGLKAEAQSQRRCESIQYPGTIQIFEGRCPRGWLPA
jgi:hypothetical protein